MNNLTDEKLLQIIWDYMAVSTPPQPSDAIVIGGCSEPGPAVRAAELYHAGFAPVIVCSGYKQEGMTVTEADFHAEIAVQHGVPESAILREEQATNTGQNIMYTHELLIKNNIIPQRIILVHKPYMARRFLATAEAQWPDPQPAFTIQHEIITMDQYIIRQGMSDTIRKILGDFKRIRHYVQHGFQTEQHIPDMAQAAFDLLVSRNHQIR
jgi:uncharacterized SAM-binding protein YcdF (DUF218 family)